MKNTEQQSKGTGDVGLLQDGIHREGAPLTRGILTQSEDCTLEAELYELAENKHDFISFLRFCSERLDRGETVQVIWRDYREIISGKLK